MRIAVLIAFLTCVGSNVLSSSSKARIDVEDFGVVASVMLNTHEELPRNENSIKPTSLRKVFNTFEDSSPNLTSTSVWIPRNHVSYDNAKGSFAKCFDLNNCSVVYHMFEENGWFASPRYPKTYPANSNACWYFPYMGIIPYSDNFYFEHFCLDDQSYLVVDSVAYFGPRLNYTSCSNTGYYFWVPRYTDLRFQFKSGDEHGFKGFNISFRTPATNTIERTTPNHKEDSFRKPQVGSDLRSVNLEKENPANCFDMNNCSFVHYIFDIEGAFTSPHYPGKYPKNANVCWYFPYNTMNNSGYKFTFQDFCLNKGAKFTINSNQYGGVYHSYTGCFEGGKQFETPKNRDLFFRFESKDINRQKGFNISFSSM